MMQTIRLERLLVGGAMSPFCCASCEQPIAFRTELLEGRGVGWKARVLGGARHEQPAPTGAFTTAGYDEALDIGSAV